MSIKNFKPVTHTLRWKQVSDFTEITTDEPYKPLTYGIKRKSGRASNGRITIRHRGGGHKKLWRIIDFKRDKYNIEGRVVSIEYDPNRSARIALISYKDGEKRYIIAPVSLKVGDTVISGPDAKIAPGNSLPLENIPLGIEIHNIELKPGRGGKLVRSAGGLAQIIAKEGDYCQVKMPSGEIRLISKKCYATIGQVGNIEHNTISIGKAGRSRWLGIRPRNRAVSMNPVDHPMGGGEGKSSGGRHPCSPKGMIAKGLKTRKKRNITDKFIIIRRK